MNVRVAVVVAVCWVGCQCGPPTIDRPDGGSAGGGVSGGRAGGGVAGGRAGGGVAGGVAGGGTAGGGTAGGGTAGGGTAGGGTAGGGTAGGGSTAGGTAAPDSGCAPITGIIAWWDGDAFDGGTATDLINAQNAIVTGGATQIPGRVGSGFSFQTSTALLEVPNPSNLTPQSALTFEAWVRPRSTPTGYNRIFSKQLDGSGPDSAYILGIGGMGGIYFSLFRSPTIQTYIDGANPLTINAWNHIAGTWDGLAMRCYLNGVQQIEALQFTPPYQSSTQPVRIGSGGTSTFRFDGDVDELTVYDRALTATEVAAIFAAGPAGKCKPP